MENVGTNYGVGFIPTLEITGAQDPTKITFPTSHALNTELCALLAMTEPANTVEKAEYENSIQADQCPATTETLAYKWPSAGKEVSASKSAKQSAGKHSILSISRGN